MNGVGYSNNNFAKEFPTVRNDLLTRGWYRFAKIKGANLTNAKGNAGYSVIIVIKTFYSYGGNNCFFALLNSSYEKSNFTILGSQISGNVITRIRHVVDSRDDTSYIEFYYNVNHVSIKNPVTVNLYSVTDGGGYRKWELIDYIPVQETQEGVTVFSSADILSKDRQVVTNSDIVSFKKIFTFSSGIATLNISEFGFKTEPVVLITPYNTTATIRVIGISNTELKLASSSDGALWINVLLKNN